MSNFIPQIMEQLQRVGPYKEETPSHIQQGESNLIIRCCRKKFSCVVLFFITIILIMEVIKTFMEKNYDSFIISMLKDFMQNNDTNLLNTL